MEREIYIVSEFHTDEEGHYRVRMDILQDEYDVSVRAGNWHGARYRASLVTFVACGMNCYGYGNSPVVAIRNAIRNYRNRESWQDIPF